jgi:hypothetical protein
LVKYNSEFVIRITHFAAGFRAVLPVATRVKQRFGRKMVGTDGQGIVWHVCVPLATDELLRKTYFVPFSPLESLDLLYTVSAVGFYGCLSKLLPV